MKNKLTFLLLAIILISFVSAGITLEIQNPGSFSEGEKMYFDYTILSDSNTQATFISAIICPYAPNKYILERSISLVKDVPFMDTEYSIEISENNEPQTCKAILQIVSPESLREEKTFEISTNPSFEFFVMTCADQDCQRETKVFEEGETTYLDFYSSIAEVDITTTLIHPDNTSEQITLPTELLSILQGNYHLESIASKQDYTSITSSLSFAVIKEGISIETRFICNPNDLCEEGENSQSCPQDCETGGEDNYCDKYKDKKCDPDCIFYKDLDCMTSTIIISVSTIVAIVLVIGLLVYFIRKRRITDKKIQL